MSKNLNRRNFLKKSVIVTGVAAGLSSFEEKLLLAHEMEKEFKRSQVNDNIEPVKGLPKGKLGNYDVSRLIIGSNLFFGGAHARNLKYVSELMSRYFTDDKVMDTLQLCEENGINTNIGAPEEVNRYNKERGGNIKSMAQLDPGHHNWKDDDRTDGKISITKEDIRETVEEAAEQGCIGAHLLGCRGDRWVKIKRFDMLNEFVSCCRKNGLLAGIGGHDKRVPIACENEGVDADYYFKTMHPESYWGVLDEDEKEPFLVDSFKENDYDCMWEQWPDDTIKFMTNVKKPWIGFKVLAAGAVHPAEGFKFAFENGVDFVCAGMFDWQVRDNVSIAKNLLIEDTIKNRKRPWRA